MSIEKHKAFLDSFEGEKGLPEEMHGWRFSTDIDDFGIDDYAELDGAHFQNNFVAYLMERVRRAESRQIPDLNEKATELMRDAMDAQFHFTASVGSEISNAERKELMDKAHAFRALCSPKVKP